MKNPSGVLEIFKELTSAPTAPFHEESVIKKAKGWIKNNFGNGITVKEHRGGLVVSYGERGAPALALAAHLDHPGFSLDRVNNKGARAELLGGLPKDQLVGAAVQAFAAGAPDNRPEALGRFGSPDGELYPVTWTSAPPRVRPAFAVLDLPACEVGGPWLASRSIDDLLGCAISLEVLRRLVRERAKANLIVLLHRAEEVGFIGALDLIESGAVDPGTSVLSIETSKRLPRAVPGRGPILRTGDKAVLFDPNLEELLREAAKGRRVQRRRMNGGTCEATAYQAYGYEAGGLAIPLVNYHNRGPRRVLPEMVKLADIQPAVEVLVAAAKLFPGKTLRGALRSRLGARLKKMAPRLN